MTPVLTDPALADLPGISHGFFTREGGVSEGLYTSLNVGFGSGDDEARVRENRARAMRAIGIAEGRLATLYQVHSARVETVSAPFDAKAAPRADGMVTKTPGVAIGILTADCAPVLFADAEARIIGAAHAGWRGALSGVLEGTLREMERLGARRERIRAAIGPCIGAASYEVGPEFPAPFVGEDPGTRRFFTAARRSGHFMFDLEGLVAHRLGALGLAAVGRLNRDTCAEESGFFSYRRSTLRGEPDYGRGLSAIAIEA
ncbi:MAG: peptidoglycan editing factor PgeF [Pseudomonadota bacterium]|jgi:YfiH family protein